MPIIGAVTGGLDFSNYFVPLSSEGDGGDFGRGEEAGRGAGVGQLLTIVINFLIVAWVLFLVVKASIDSNGWKPPNQRRRRRRPGRRPYLSKCGISCGKNLERVGYVNPAVSHLQRVNFAALRAKHPDKLLQDAVQALRRRMNAGIDVVPRFSGSGRAG